MGNIFNHCTASHKYLQTAVISSVQLFVQARDHYLAGALLTYTFFAQVTRGQTTYEVLCGFSIKRYLTVKFVQYKRNKKQIYLYICKLISLADTIPNLFSTCGLSRNQEPYRVGEIKTRLKTTINVGDNRF